MAQGCGGLTMEIIDKRTKKEEWNLGDVLVNETGHLKCLIVKDNNGKYCLMDITPNVAGNYSLVEGSYYGDSYENLTELYCQMSSTWHKVNAKLVIE